MADTIFPERPVPPPLTPTPVVRVVRREPLGVIEQVLAISIDEIVNEPRWKRIVEDFYRISRRIDNEAWLRRRLEERETEAWIAAHL